MSSRAARLREGAEAVAKGRFRIDARRALAKLRDFRLATPEHYVLDLLRAAVASGAGRVDVKAGARDLELVFDGEPFPREALDELFGHALVGGRDLASARLRLLALGVVGALGLRPTWIHVESGGHAVRVTPPDVLEPAQARGTGTRIVVRERVGWRALRDAVRGPLELQVMRATTTHFPVPLAINGQAWTPPRLGGAPVLAHVERTAGPVRVVVGALHPGSDVVPRVEVALLGVTVAARPIPSAMLPVFAWGGHDALRRNASGSDVVEGDKALQEVEREVEAAILELLGPLCALLGGPQADEARAVLRLAAERTGLARRDSTAGLAALAQAPLLPGPSGEWVSIAELRAEAAAGRPIRFHAGSCARELYDPPVVMVRQSLDEVADLVPPVAREDVALRVRALREREVNRRRFDAQPVESPRLPPGSYTLRAPVSAPGMVGEAGLLPGGDQAAASIRFLKGGRLLAHVTGRPLGLPVCAVVDSDRFEADASWSTIAPDAARVAALDAVLAAVKGALGASVGDDASEELRAQARALVATLAERKEKIPPEVARAAVYPLAGGGWTSLNAIGKLGATARMVPYAVPHPALDDAPVLVLASADERAVRTLFPKLELDEVSAQLEREEEIRRRQAGPKESARVDDVLFARVPVAAEGLEGEIAGPVENSSHVRLRLLRDGFRVETVRVDARYGGALAAVDAPGLQVAPGWDAVVRDAEYERVRVALQEAERELVGAMLARLEAGTGAPQAGGAPPAAVVTAVLTFVARERARSGDEILRRALAAPILRGPRGGVSIGQVMDARRATKNLWIAPPDDAEALSDAPEELVIVLAEGGLADLVVRIAGGKPRHPREELGRIRARRDFERAAPWVPPLPPVFRDRVAQPPFTGEVGLDEDGGPGARAEILVQGRLLCLHTQKSRLPLRAVLEVEPQSVDTAERALPLALRDRLKRILQDAEAALVRAAIADPGRPGAHAVLIQALPARLEQVAPGLREVPVFPTLAGTLASAAELDAAPRVTFVTERLVFAEPRTDQVVVADDPHVLRAVRGGFAKKADRTEELRAEAAASAARQRTPARAEIRVEAKGVWRRRAFKDGPREGEVALLREPERATVQLLRQRRPLARQPFDGPAGCVAAINDDALAPTAEGARDDAALRAALGAVHKELGVLGTEVAAAWPSLSEKDRAHGRGALVHLAAWLLHLDDEAHGVQGLPVLETTDGGSVSFAELLALRRVRGHVPFSGQQGRSPFPGVPVWRPREGERALLPRRIKVRDVSDAVVGAARFMSGPQAASLAVKAASDWREPVRGRVQEVDIEGEVALVSGRTGLRVELLRDRRVLETADLEHPVAAEARMNCDALLPDAAWARARRDGTFQAVRRAVDAALEQLLVRRLASHAVAHDVLAAALRWKDGGPVRQAALGVPAFEDLEGRPVTLGRVLEEVSGRGRIAFLSEGDLSPEPGRLVLRAPGLELLAAVGAKVEDLTAAAAEAARRAKRLDERRVKERRFAARALLRVEIDEDGWRGEIALPDPPGKHGIVLVRDGIAADRFHSGSLGVAGVLEHDALPVDEEWTRAELDATAQARLRGFVERLLASLLAQAPRLDSEARALAAHYALRSVVDEGVSAPAHLDRLTGLPDALARCPLLPSADGRWLDVRSVAEQVLRGTKVAVAAFSVPAAEVARTVVLRAKPGAPFVAALEAALGISVVRLEDRAAWLAEQAEQDPDEGTPLAQGLARLRGEAALLHGAALGRLSPDELAGIRLRRGGGDGPVAYDAARRVVLLDAGHLPIRRALEEAAERPDRIYVLLAAVYGAVNRALDRVTDADEARLSAGLLAHLAASPHLLGGRPGRRTG